MSSTAAIVELVRDALRDASIRDEIKAIVQDAADFAQSSPEPDEKELWTDILIEEGTR